VALKDEYLLLKVVQGGNMEHKGQNKKKGKLIHY